MIVAYLGSTLKGYCEKFQEYLDKLRLVCPICGEGVHIHGYYNRKLNFGEDKVSIKILRVKCIGCNRTHAVIPDFVSPRKHFSAAEREAVIEERENGIPIERIESAASVSTVKRWISEFERKSTEILGVLGSMLFKVCGTISSPIILAEGCGLKAINSLLEDLPSIESSGLFIGKANIWCLSCIPNMFL